MNAFIYTYQEVDHGLDVETIETLHVERIGTIAVNSSSIGSKTLYSGNDPISNTGVLLEAMMFIEDAQRNSKTLKIDSIVHDTDSTIKKGIININRFL